MPREYNPGEGPRGDQPVLSPGDAGYTPPPPPDQFSLAGYLGIPGLPEDVARKIDEILRSGAPDAEQRAIAYLRSTPWYAQTYRGIGLGVQKGIISNEADYRAYVNSVQNTYRQFYGRDATGDEIEAFRAAGYTPGVIAQKGQGYAYIQANRGELQYLSGAFSEGRLTDEELAAYGEQQAGLGSDLGAKITTKVDQAVQRIRRVFEGSLATSPLALDSLSQSQQRQRKPDISA